MGQRRIPVTGHAAIAGITGIGIKRLAGLVHGVLELAADRERDVVDPELRHPQRDALRVWERVAILDRFLREEADADREIAADALAHLGHDAAEHAQTALER